jgi:RimJ/RimL family protein N-acetyltransferase
MVSPFPAESERLQFAPISEHDIAELVEVYNSNPFYMEAAEGKPAITLKEVERDFVENNSYPGSFNIAIREKGKSKIIGIAQFILNNPRDNNPWLGLLMLHKEKQGQGYAKEFLLILLDWYKQNGYASLHLGVLEKNSIVVPFYQRCGFQQYEVLETEKLGKVICMAYQMV